MDERTRAYVVLVFMPLFFSSTLIIGRAAVPVIEPWTLAYWRWMLASVILFPFAVGAILRSSDILIGNWRLIAFLSLLLIVICGGGVFVALRYTTATNATLIYTMSPIFILIIETLFRGHRPSLRQVGGILLAFLGVAVIVLRGDIDRLLAFRFNPGDIIILFASVCFAVYSTLLRSNGLTKVPTHALFAIILLTGTALLVPLMLWEAVTHQAMPTRLDAWASIAGLAVFASVLPFLMYQYGIKIVGAPITATFIYLLPAYGVVLAVVFLGEAFKTYHAFGFVMIMTGIVAATAQFPRRRIAQTV